MFCVLACLVCRSWYKFSHLPAPRTCRIFGIRHSSYIYRRICVNILPHSQKRTRINHRKSNRHTFHLVLDRFPTSSSSSSPPPSLPTEEVSFFDFSVWLFHSIRLDSICGFFCCCFSWAAVASSSSFSSALPSSYAPNSGSWMYSMLVTMRLLCFCYDRTNERTLYILLNERCDDDDKTVWWRQQWQQYSRLTGIWTNTRTHTHIHAPAKREREREWKRMREREVNGTNRKREKEMRVKCSFIGEDENRFSSLVLPLCRTHIA